MLGLFEFIFVELLYCSLLEKHLPRYKISLLNEKIDKFIQEQDEIFELNIKIFNLNAKCKIPDLYEISEDNLPRDKKRTSKWGDTFTIYKTSKGTKLHTKYNCCSASSPVHIYWYRNYCNITELFCKKCARYYVSPDMSWYENYIQYEQSKIKRQSLENDCNKLYKEIKTLHKKCNSFKTKILIIFNRKNKTSLMSANKKYINLHEENKYNYSLK